MAAFTFAAPALAAGFEVTSSSGVEIGNAVVTPINSKWRYELDTDFQLAIATSKWHLTSTEDTFSVFKAKTSLIPRAWLTTTSAGSVTNIRTAIWGDAWVSVSLTKASALERSEAYLPGWRATAVNSTTGRIVQLKVQRTGLIEKVDVPEGTWVIHFHYRAPYIEVSTAASAASIVLRGSALGGWLSSPGRADVGTVRLSREDSGDRRRRGSHGPGARRRSERARLPAGRSR